MKIGDFKIGDEFVHRAGFRWRVTDVGQRVITAISLEVDDPIWTQGPPYLQDEKIFDEHEMKHCFSNVSEDLDLRLESLGRSAHPHFGIDYIQQMLEYIGHPDHTRYHRRSLLRFNRVYQVGEIDDVIHPVSVRQDGPVWSVIGYTLFGKTFINVPDTDLARMPLSTEADLVRVKALFATKKLAAQGPNKTDIQG